MPSYADVFDNPDGDAIRPGDAWNLVSYILSLRAPSTQTAGAAAQKEPVP